MKAVLLIIIGSLLLISGCVADPLESPRRIALSFDDAPRPATPLLAGRDRGEMLLAALDAAEVESVVFFVTTRHVEGPARSARLAAYAKAGHLLANHSHAHGWLRRQAADDYLADIALADRQLRPMAGFRPWFRFPFLDEGDTVEKRDQVRTGLQQMGYVNGYVTVDNYDWYLDRLAQERAQAGRPVDMDALRALYVDHLVDAVEFYDGIATEVLGRSPVHSLLLHENDLAALFVGDLVEALRARGWEIVSPDVAYADPIAEQIPETLFNNQGRVAAIAHAAGRAAATLVPAWEDEAVLEAQFRTQVDGATD